MKARYTVRISPEDVGQRVTVRARTHAHPPATDTVGVLRSWQDGVLLIERRDGSVSQVDENDLLTAKIVPEPRRRGPTGSVEANRGGLHEDD